MCVANPVVHLLNLAAGQQSLGCRDPVVYNKSVIIFAQFIKMRSVVFPVDVSIYCISVCESWMKHQQ